MFKANSDAYMLTFHNPIPLSDKTSFCQTVSVYLGYKLEAAMILEETQHTVKNKKKQNSGEMSWSAEG